MMFTRNQYKSLCVGSADDFSVANLSHRKTGDQLKSRQRSVTPSRFDHKILKLRGALFTVAVLSLLVGQAQGAQRSDEKCQELPLEGSISSSSSRSAIKEGYRPPSFDTIWQSVAAHGHPYDICSGYFTEGAAAQSLIRDPKSQKLYNQKEEMEKPYRNVEDYIKVNLLDYKAKEHMTDEKMADEGKGKLIADETSQHAKYCLTENKFPYLFREEDRVQHLVLWLPKYKWSDWTQNLPASEHIRLIPSKLQKLKTMVNAELIKKFEYTRVDDKDIVMFVNYRNKLMLPSLPHVQVLVRSASPVTWKWRNFEDKSSLLNQSAYEAVIAQVLEKNPLLTKMVEVGLHTDNGKSVTVPFIPADVLREAKHVTPQYNDRVSKFFQKHGDVSNRKLVYGKDYVFALHGTKEEVETEAGKVIRVWDLITKGGLRQTGDKGACGPGIYLTKHAGICTNSGGNAEFTTVQYGTNGTKDKETCRIVIVLVMNPKERKAITTEDKRDCSDWLVSPEEDTLILKLLRADPIPMAKLLLKYDKSEIARKTRMKQNLCPDAADKNILNLREMLKKFQKKGLNKTGHWKTGIFDEEDKRQSSEQQRLAVVNKGITHRRLANRLATAEASF